MDSFWSGRTVLVTGGSGFIGSYVVERLVALGACVTATVSPRVSDLPKLEHVRRHIRIRSADLTDLKDCMRVCRKQSVILAVAHADGSIAFKNRHPAYIFRQNMMITLNTLEAACRSGAERILITSSAEVYPHNAPTPTLESEAFCKLSDRLTDGYTWSKRASELAARIFVEEFGVKLAIARPNNVYGPRDYFDTERGRVIPTFIRKAFEGQEPIVIWGDGSAVRTFLYVEDLSRGLTDLIEKCPECDAVNFGGEEEISIRVLAETVVRLSGCKVAVVCDATKPVGGLRRVPDVTNARNLLSFTPCVRLEEGLMRTIHSYWHERRDREPSSPGRPAHELRRTSEQ
jgi:GDP-L-fucose synthase